MGKLAVCTRYKPGTSPKRYSEYIRQFFLNERALGVLLL